MRIRKRGQVNNPLSLNVYSYSLNNPLTYTDLSGHNAEAAAYWYEGMWWLAGIDGPIPVGDIIYIGGGIFGGKVIEAAIEEPRELELDYDNPAIPCPAPARPDSYDSEDYEQQSSRNKSVAGAFGNPNNQGNNKNNNKLQLKKFTTNRAANEIAQQNGFKNAEDLKQSIVGKENISKYNMKYDPTTSNIYLESVQGSKQIATSYSIY